MPEVAATQAAPKEPKAPKIEQNGVVRPNAGTATAKVWEISDAMSAKLNAPAPRKDVLAQTTADGINAATAATQYGKWRKFNGLAKEVKVAAPAAEAAAAPADVVVE